MSHCLRVKAIVPADAKWHQMKAVRDACVAANVNIPSEVDEFFGWTVPDEGGMTIKLDDGSLCCARYSADMCEGLTIDMSKLPANVKLLRVYISY